MTATPRVAVGGGAGSSRAGTAGIVLKSAREIGLMRAAGGLVRSVLSKMEEMAGVGVTTAELNAVAEEIICQAGATPLFKGVCNQEAKFPFPAALCTSINEQVVHGIPSERPLCDGDVVSIDCGVLLQGYCGDSAVTIPIGEVSPEVSRLLSVTRRSLEMVIERVKPGRMWSEIARDLQKYVEGHGFSVVRDFVGHGIGREMHEEPKVPNYWDRRGRNRDFELLAGMVIAVEPMVNMGSHKVEFGDRDGWVVVTKDRMCAAHYEHTLAVTSSGCEVLSRGEDGGR